MRDSYTRYPRAILWLVREGELRDGTRLDSFYLSKLPITNVQYEAFDKKHTRNDVTPNDDDPASNITFEQAEAYCAWYADVSRKPMRLPTLAEYRHACILGEPERLTDDQVPTDGTLGDLQRTKPSKAGFIALLGGLWEWTQDGQLYGGSYNSKRDEIDTWNATEVSHPHHANDVGFRIARSLK